MSIEQLGLLVASMAVIIASLIFGFLKQRREASRDASRDAI